MSSLEVVSLRNNSLSGNLPVNIGNCGLRRLLIAHNMLDGQVCIGVPSFSCSPCHTTGSGAIPKEISQLHSLEYLGMEHNEFTGALPSTIFNISTLRYLSVAYNNLSGSLPQEIGNLTMLDRLYLSFNIFQGIIPQEIAYLQELEILALTSNSLTGSIPVGIFNLSKLISIAIDRNLLSGYVPTTIGYNLPNLEELYLHTNHLQGQILNSITNCTQLTILEIGFNQFSGSIPTSLADLSILRVLNLNGNNFISDSDLSFFTSLANSRYLEELLLSNNPLNGSLPPSTSNLSELLTTMSIDNCMIKGRIPDAIANLTNLETLSLTMNDLVGSIPETFRGLETLQIIYLGVNQLTGSLPASLCTFRSLGLLDIADNQISGPIPECLANVSYLRELYLSNNSLDSSITQSLWNLNNLLHLDLSSNYFSGSLGPGIGNLEAAVSIDLSRNELSGSIPSDLGRLQTLIDISLYHNRFQGSIPESLSNMLGLEMLDLSENNLSGVIPKSLEALKYLTNFNVSYNDLSSEIPSDGPFRNFTDQAFMLNNELCGPPRFNVPPCRTNSGKTSTRRKRLGIIFIFVGVAAVTILLSIIVLLVLMRCRKKDPSLSVSDSPSAQGHRRISYYELQQATDGFNESNLLGKGGYGSIYKGVLGDGTVLAVKVFNLEVEGALKSFDAESEVLRNVRHRNLTKITSSCSNNSFKALILEYMPNGSLDRWLYSTTYFLDILQRLNIMIDVACALEYLHYDGYSTPVIHCDLKPSNVLLDEDMVDHVSDFGMAKLLGVQDSSTFTSTLATFGYMAPEYGMEGTVSPACDVYSYGIVLMEVFTRTRPSDEHFSGDFSIKSWVQNSLPNEVLQVVDAKLIDSDEKHISRKLKCLTSIFEVSIDCTAESPRDRPSIRDVVPKLNKIILELIGVKRTLNN